MQAVSGLRFSVAALVLISAVFHLAVGFCLFATEATASTIDLVFGIVYIILSVGLFVGKRVFIYLCLVFSAIDGVGGAIAHLVSHALDPLIAVVIDVVIIIFCSFLLFHKAVPEIEKRSKT